MLFLSFQPFVNSRPGGGGAGKLGIPPVRRKRDGFPSLPSFPLFSLFLFFLFFFFFFFSSSSKSYNPNEIPSRREVIGLMHYAGTRSRERQAVVVRKMERTERVRRGFSCATRVTS